MGRRTKEAALSSPASRGEGKKEEAGRSSGRRQRSEEKEDGAVAFTVGKKRRGLSSLWSALRGGRRGEAIAGVARVVARERERHSEERERRISGGRRRRGASREGAGGEREREGKGGEVAASGEEKERSGEVAAGDLGSGDVDAR
ncbi:octapeptide-repeat protein T2-like [Zingiber officinale]|uniref:octapeptide-repeat protein T2-like n=1 Tax=Zingiber officinale TaxID=94328 RepID=UPI001C4D57CF|nr:octapeptide-repeat protein T2-like [Zingiber officinale]